jgi:hypothetical protein
MAPCILACAVLNNMYLAVPCRVLCRVLCCALHRREKQEQMLKQVNESTLHRLTAGQNGLSAQEQAAKGRLISQVGAVAAAAAASDTGLRMGTTCMPANGGKVQAYRNTRDMLHTSAA